MTVPVRVRFPHWRAALVFTFMMSITDARAL